MRKWWNRIFSDRRHRFTRWQVMEKPATGFMALNGATFEVQQRVCLKCGLTQQLNLTTFTDYCDMIDLNHDDAAQAEDPRVAETSV